MADVVAAHVPDGPAAGTVGRTAAGRGAPVHVRKQIAHSRHLGWAPRRAAGRGVLHGRCSPRARRVPPGLAAAFDASGPTTILGRDR
jgi:hypothetical protein